MKKFLLILLVGFTIGFFVHALVTPDLFANGIIFIPQAPQITPGQAQQTQTNGVPTETKITFNGSAFSRTNVTIQRSRYVSIINMSEDLTMDLNSTEPDLSTPRPYAFEEMVRTRIDKPGQYVVADRRNPTTRMVITVK